MRRWGVCFPLEIKGRLSLLIYGTKYVIEKITPDRKFAICQTESLDATYEEEGLTFGLGAVGRSVKVPIEKLLTPDEREALRKARGLFAKYGTNSIALKHLYGTSELSIIEGRILSRLEGSKRYAAVRGKAGAMRQTEIRILT